MTRDMPKEAGTDKKGSPKSDAEGQFVRLRGRNDNSGVSSAVPRVIAGDDDATFENKPGDRALGTVENLPKRGDEGTGRK